EKGDARLLGDVLAVVLEVALEGEPVARAVIEAGAAELAVSIHATDAVFELGRRGVEAHAEFLAVSEAMADVHGAAVLAEVAAGAADTEDVLLACAFRDHVDDARRARDSVLQRVGSLERLQAGLVLDRHGDDARDGHASIETV